MKDVTINLGTYSSASLRIQELIPAAMEALRGLTQSAPEALREEASAVEAQLTLLPFGVIPSYALDDDGAEWWESENAMDAYVDLSDRLDELLSPYRLYWGCTEGNGSDIGIWPFLPEYGDDETIYRDLSEVPEGEEDSDFYLVNDHGNVSFYSGGEEVWSIV